MIISQYNEVIHFDDLKKKTSVRTVVAYCQTSEKKKKKKITEFLRI